jgi:uncharacterized protein (TIGR03437 family)
MLRRRTRLVGLCALAFFFLTLAIPASAQGFTGCQSQVQPEYVPGIGMLDLKITLKIYTNGTLVATFELEQQDKNTWEITDNGNPFIDNFGDFIFNPDGDYSTADAATLADFLCPGGTPFSGTLPGAAIARIKNRTSTVPLPASGQAASQYVSADFNGDGVLDTAAADSGSVLVTLYGKDGSVLSKKTYATGAPYAGEIVSADFNGDGIPDLALTILPNAPPGYVAVLLGKGDGTFSNPVMYPAGPQPLAIAAVDLNSDGKIDLVVSNSVYAAGTSTGTIDVLIGKGDGTFAAPVSYSAGQVPTSLIATDLNGDGKPDVAAIDSQQDTVDALLVLLNKGDGTLRSPTGSLVTGTRFGTLSYTDLNHDGKTDLLIADRDGSTLTVAMGNGDGTFQSPTQYVTGAGPASAGIIPLSDGNTAVLTGDSVSADLIATFVSPNGTVNAPPIQALGTQLSSIAVADLNGDGKDDIVVTDKGGNRFFVLLNSGGQFANPVPYLVGSSPGGSAVADVNGDGKPDLIVADNNGIEVLPGKGDGTFGALQTSAVSGASAGLAGLAVADFNGDGKLDAAVTLNTGQVAVLQGQENGTFTPGATVPLPNSSSPIVILTADFNRDGKPDLAVGYDLQTGGALAILLGKGDGTFQAPAIVNLPGFVISLAVGDVNKDGKPDIIAGVQENTGDQVAVLLGNGDGTFQSPLTNQTAAGLPSISIIDLNQDGNPDLLLGDCCGLTEATYMLGRGDGTFAPEVHVLSGPNPSYIGWGNFTGRAKPDLAIAGNSTGHGTLVLLANNFTNASAVVSSANPGSKAIAPGSLATAYGADLATGTAGSTTDPRPTQFGGTSVYIVDSTGARTAAPLVYVSAGQVNFLVPSTIATGAATVVIQSGDGTISTAQTQVAAIAPGIFTLDASGLAAAVAILVSSSGAQTVEQVYAVNSAGEIVAAPIDMGAATDQVVLALFGTGIAAAGTSGVTVSVAGINAPVLYAGAQGSFDGLDQVNITLPRSLVGMGAVSIQLTAGGIVANTTTVTIQ